MKKKDIIIREIIPLRGPNMWTYRPVLEAWVELGDLEILSVHHISSFGLSLVSGRGLSCQASSTGQ